MGPGQITRQALARDHLAWRDWPPRAWAGHQQPHSKHLQPALLGYNRVEARLLRPHTSTGTVAGKRHAQIYQVFPGTRLADRQPPCAGHWAAQPPGHCSRQALAQDRRLVSGVAWLSTCTRSGGFAAPSLDPGHEGCSQESGVGMHMQRAHIAHVLGVALVKHTAVSRS